ncbi:hypothetical protein CWO91_36095 [Bradyrhizobium genosp. SA-3]|uniref:hypothetical protein n=1 Tax=Bradyrhizobium genosp. SA-3 TaxID=508868 RepID=UPI001029720E|nr:hypothetical protein [Bradyrhizobium genosp. SA-3]RZM99335.1 hypothetical protein CWO91_36095 [Bradyrhizobium genosp. SA-3]
MIAWEATAGPTERRQGSRCARPAPPARGLDGAPLARLFCFHAFMACSARSRSCCKLKRLYDAIENGVADVSDPLLKERVTELKSIRDQARADAERAKGA